MEADSIISIAEATAAVKGGFDINRHRNYPTTDLAAFAITEPIAIHIGGIVNSIALNKWLNDTVINGRIFPTIESMYGIDRQYLSMKDLFIVKYDEHGQNRLQIHQDSSSISFNIALNQYDVDYTAGGTYFALINDVIKIDTGDILIHPSKLYHSGHAISKGTRYLLVGFVNVDKFTLNTFYQTFGEYAYCFQLRYISSLYNNVDKTKQQCTFFLWPVYYQISHILKGDTWICKVIKYSIYTLSSLFIIIIGIIIYGYISYKMY